MKKPRRKLSSREHALLGLLTSVALLLSAQYPLLLTIVLVQLVAIIATP
jgi:hypothetical protein